jgi:hypothetical protein
MENLNFVKQAFTQDTGGGMECDVLVLKDGTALVISEEAIVLYKDLEAWEENVTLQIGTIFRPQESQESA